MRYKTEDISALNKIYNATAELIKQKEYGKITCSGIISSAKISRSTFYIYFKSKDQILIHICNDMFDHIFSKELSKEKGHDFSKYSPDDLKHIIIHLYYHFLEDKELIIPILNSTGSNIFLSQLRKRIKPIIVELLNRRLIGNNSVPEDIKIHQYINAAIALTQYYLRHGENMSPETICDYFLELYQ